ncbi:hypothetical protein TrCOL_g1221 [Triparma columacea]|uniref:Uncharacterized protein n=1 Tax=Triparma columacea TaxID=722753 RepID=A0A9W7GIL4_9STRA|nr:hypothetical protein TrCOL_g1221 [Triparma columacea]
MKYTAFLIASAVATTQAFTPTMAPKVSNTALNANFFATVFDMDLWKDKSDSNDYGGRSKKVEWTSKGLGKIEQGKSYVPSGMTAAQFNAMRAKERQQKEKNYQKNVAKAGKFEDYTEFYKKRGTDLNGSWLKSVTNGHKMVKTKYDWGGEDGQNLSDMKQFESNLKGGKPKFGQPKFGKKK